jgi:hypothetical protein
MKRFGMLLMLLCAALMLAACGADGRYSATLITTGTHTVRAGETLHGELVVLGGRVALQPGSRVTGALHIFDGTVAVAGAVDGDVTMVGGALHLGPGAALRGDLNHGGGVFERSPSAQIGGRVNTGAGVPIPARRSPQAVVEQLVWWLAEAIGIAALAALAVQFMPRPTARVADAIVRYPVVAVAMGMLAGVVGISLLVLMIFTIVLIPVMLLGVLLGGMAVISGWVALGAEVGMRLARWRRWPLSRPAAAFIGTLLVMGGLNLLGAAPVIGGLLALLAATVALGAVLLTRFGTRVFVPDMAPADAPR